jgi:2-C-methyl-D-erythritol 4-phosphate cytidylyltransferase
MTRVHAIVAAGGEGSRFGGERPKQLVKVHGRSILDWSIGRLLEVAESVAVAIPGDLVGRCPSEFDVDPRVVWVAGGASRWRSVREAFQVLAVTRGDLVAVHDAARPALTAEDLAAVLVAAERSGAAVLGRPVSDTVKRLAGDEIVGTVDRTELFRAETPQVFEVDLLRRGLELAAHGYDEPTDEASIVERLEGATVIAVPASAPNPKVTEPADLELIEHLLAGAS